MKHDPNDIQNDARLIGGVRSALNRGIANLDRKTTERLQDTRQLALGRQAQPVAALSLAGVGHGIGRFFADSLHHHSRAILAVIALAIGAAGVQVWRSAQHAVDLAEIDSALLSDEVPPGALTDQGFLEWLNHPSSQLQEDSPSP
jgi:hypothetical protein